MSSDDIENSSIDKPGFMVRRVEEKDYSDVLNISKDIWDGHDYLPKVFHTWLHQAGLFIGVEDLSSMELVAVSHVALLHDGSAWLGGLRVRPDHQGKGISRMMINAQLRYAMEKLREGLVQRIACATFIKNEASKYLCLSYGMQIKQTYLLLSWNKDCKPRPLQVEDWEPSWEEIEALPYFNDSDRLIIQFFKMQKINQAWWEQSKKKTFSYLRSTAPGDGLNKAKNPIVSCWSRLLPLFTTGCNLLASV